MNICEDDSKGEKINLKWMERGKKKCYSYLLEAYPRWNIAKNDLTQLSRDEVDYQKGDL